MAGSSFDATTRRRHGDEKEYQMAYKTDDDIKGISLSKRKRGEFQLLCCLVLDDIDVDVKVSFPTSSWNSRTGGRSRGGTRMCRVADLTVSVLTFAYLLNFEKEFSTSWTLFGRFLLLV